MNILEGLLSFFEAITWLESRLVRCIVIFCLLAAGIVGIVKEPRAAWGYALLSVSIAWGLGELWFYYKHEHD